MSNLPVIVVGGGLGGAMAALALARKGFDILLLEEAEEFGVIGYGIQLGPNVFWMLDRLGVADAVLAVALRPKAMVMYDWIDGGVIARIPTGESFLQRFRKPYVVIHRVDLHKVLLDACRALHNVQMLPNTPVKSFADLGDRVRVDIADGRHYEGAALIGADGIRSTIRQQMTNEGPPRSLGYVAHRTIVPMSEVNFDVDTDNVVMWSGDGFHIVHYPLRDHTLFNVVTVFRTLDMAPSDTDSPHPDLARVYRDSHPTMKKLWGMMDLSRRGWVSGDRDPIRHWSRGRVTLLGDAAHPTLQSLAQGACMAIEDAVCLAGLLDDLSGDAVESAFRQYVDARYLRTARVQYESRYLWDNVYHVGGIEREVMRQVWENKSEQEMFDCVAWLYDGFELPVRKGAA
ncbi:FAD-dependent monooxygenase [Pseudorhodoplanes sp.]|uniref:FAD-dependent monooxygenase n=1 Tax=Pseudorhodoplanes sp. TaxID=1934341 RepID=UPI00391B55CA